MASKLGVRLIAYISILVICVLAFFAGTGLNLSDTDFRAIQNAMLQKGFKVAGNLSIELDEYEKNTTEAKIVFSGKVTAPVSDVSMLCYRINDIGTISDIPDAGETSAVKDYYEFLPDGDHFTTPEISLAGGENNFLLVAYTSDFANTNYVKVTVNYDFGAVASTPLENIAATSLGIEYQNDLIILKFKPEVSMERAREIISAIGGTEVGYISLLRHFQVRFEPMSYEEITEKCQTLTEEYEEIASASPEVVLKLHTNAQAPNDPFALSSQTSTVDWNEEKPGGTNWGLECIQALSAWDYEPYFRATNVGVVDLGFFDGHDDLRLYFTDNRRVVDDHGTHVAGIIGAVANNDRGIAGVLTKGKTIAYPLNAMMMDDATYCCNFSEYSYALASCVSNGASVVNYSLGNASVGQDSTEEKLLVATVLADGMAALLNQGYDFLIVQAAGNASSDASGSGLYTYVHDCNNGEFAQSYPEVWNDFVQTLRSVYDLSVNDLTQRVIVVGAVKNMSGDSPAFVVDEYSNYGDTVDIAAPGSDILSTVSSDFTGTYESYDGTSAAAPYVAAVAAMAWSTNQELTGKDIRKILIENTVYTATTMTDRGIPEYTYPVVNALKAVEAALAYERRESKAAITVKDASTGELISGADIVVSGGVEEGGILIETLVTDENGSTILEADSGDYILTITKDGYITTENAALHIPEDATAEVTYAISQTLGENEYRIVLTWGKKPSDLDSHLTGKDAAGSNIHVCYAYKKHFLNGSVFAELDVDDTSSYGPETITIHSLPAEPLLYSVHDYTNRGSSNNSYLSQSNATVSVYRGSEVLKTYTVELNHNAVCWDVFTILPDGSIQDVNAYKQGPMLPGAVGQ